MLSEMDLKENIFSYSTHQGILQQSYAYQHTIQSGFDGNKHGSDEASLRDATEHKYSLQHLFNKFSHLYKNSQVPALQHFVKHAKDLGNSTKFSQAFSIVKDMQFVKYLHLKEPVKDDKYVSSQEDHENIKFYTVCPPGTAIESKQPMFCELSFRKEALDFADHQVYKHESFDSGNVLRQPFVQFSNELLKLQDCLSVELLDYFTCALPELQVDHKEFKCAYWLCIASCLQPEPQPGCLLLFSSNIYAIVFSKNAPVLLLALPLSTLQELQICFGGQRMLFIGCAEEASLAVYTFNCYYTQRICQDLVKILMTESDYEKCRIHPLLKKDLMKLSLDWKAELPDFVCTDGFKLACKFRGNLADMVYLLYENMNDTKPALGDIQLLLYTTVKVAHMPKHNIYRSLVLTDTSVALVQDDSIFHRSSNVWASDFSGFHLDNIRLHSLRDLKCIMLRDKNDLTKMTMFFSKNNQDVNVKTRDSCLLPIVSQPNFDKNLSAKTDVWQIDLSSSKDALLLIKYVTD
ncbi:uncharacterized protein WCC33_004094 [Rhinophrynus dorsalis]